jgi:hypothetical protein
MNVDRLAFGGGLNHCLHRKSWLVVVIACLLQPCLGAASAWRIDSGGGYCQVDGACVTDGAGNYGNDEACAFTLTGPATLTREEFRIFGYLGPCSWDWLRVAGTKYCDGYNPFPAALELTAATAFDFRTDGAWNYAGFRICISSCPAGQFFVTDQGCKECAAGKWLGVTGSDEASDCIECSSGRYAAVTGSGTCTECSLGRYAAVTSLGACIECGVGRYIGVTGSDEASDCIECSSGRYAAVTGSGTCVWCAAGKVSPPGATGCASECAVGSFVSGAQCAHCRTVRLGATSM